MAWINAKSVPTKMVNHKSMRNWAVLCFVSESMCLAQTSPEPEFSVTIQGFTANPDDAVIWTSNSFLPEKANSPVAD